MNLVVGCLYRHMKTKQWYKLIGFGRDVKFPETRKVVYASTTPSHLHNHPEIMLPVGSLWFQDVEVFKSKFEPAETVYKKP